MSPVVVLSLLGLAALALTYAAVHLIRPNRFRLRARVTRWCEFSLEVDAGGTAPEAAGSAGGRHGPPGTQDA